MECLHIIPSLLDVGFQEGLLVDQILPFALNPVDFVLLGGDVFF